jgi:hypothetical protein
LVGIGTVRNEWYIVKAQAPIDRHSTIHAGVNCVIAVSANAIILDKLGALHVVE